MCILFLYSLLDLSKWLVLCRGLILQMPCMCVCIDRLSVCMHACMHGCSRAFSRRVNVVTVCVFERLLCVHLLFAACVASGSCTLPSEGKLHSSVVIATMTIMQTSHQSLMKKLCSGDIYILSCSASTGGHFLEYCYIKELHCIDKVQTYRACWHMACLLAPFVHAHLHTLRSLTAVGLYLCERLLLV